MAVVEITNGKISMDLVTSGGKFSENLGYVGQNISDSVNANIASDINDYCNALAALTTATLESKKVTYEMRLEDGQ